MTRDKNFYEKRYEGKPFLQKTFKHPGKAWREMVVLLLNFPPHVVDTIRTNWAKHQKAAAEAGPPLAPDEYAVQVVDFMTREAEVALLGLSFLSLGLTD